MWMFDFRKRVGYAIRVTTSCLRLLLHIACGSQIHLAQSIENSTTDSACSYSFNILKPIHARPMFPHLLAIQLPRLNRSAFPSPSSSPLPHSLTLTLSFSPPPQTTTPRLFPTRKPPPLNYSQTSSAPPSTPPPPSPFEPPSPRSPRPSPPHPSSPRSSPATSAPAPRSASAAVPAPTPCPSTRRRRRGRPRARAGRGDGRRSARVWMRGRGGVVLVLVRGSLREPGWRRGLRCSRMSRRRGGLGKRSIAYGDQGAGARCRFSTDRSGRRRAGMWRCRAKAEKGMLSAMRRCGVRMRMRRCGRRGISCPVLLPALGAVSGVRGRGGGRSLGRGRG